MGRGPHSARLHGSVLGRAGSRGKGSKAKRRLFSIERKPRFSVPQFPKTTATALPCQTRIRAKSILEQAALYRRILIFLPLSDATSLSRTCLSLRSQQHQAEYRHYLRFQLIQGLSSRRHSFWRQKGRIPASKSDSAYYHSLQLTPSPYTKAISQDAERTLGLESARKMSATCQQRLCRVLGAVALHRRELGYCQGMNYLAAVLLQVLGEEETFWAFNALCENYDFDLVFVSGMYRVRCVCHAVDHYVALYIPALAKRLEVTEIGAELYAARWVLTLFARELPLPLLLRLWDFFLLDGWKAVVRATLAILSHSVSTILSSSAESTFEECLKAARAPSLDSNMLLKAYTFKVTRKALGRLDAAFLTDLQTESTLNQCGLVQSLKQ